MKELAQLFSIIRFAMKYSDLSHLGIMLSDNLANKNYLIVLKIFTDAKYKLVELEKSIKMLKISIFILEQENNKVFSL